MAWAMAFAVIAAQARQVPPPLQQLPQGPAVPALPAPMVRPGFSRHNFWR